MAPLAMLGLVTIAYFGGLRLVSQQAASLRLTIMPVRRP